MVEGSDSLDFNIKLGESNKAPQTTDEVEIVSEPIQMKVADVEAIEGGGAAPRNFVPKFLTGAAHPSFCILHFAFKLAAILMYVILGMLLDDKLLAYILVSTLCIFDFWVVKNLTGR